MNGWPRLSTRPSCRLVGIAVSLGMSGSRHQHPPKKDLVISRVPAHKLHLRLYSFKKTQTYTRRIMTQTSGGWGERGLLRVIFRTGLSEQLAEKQQK